MKKKKTKNKCDCARLLDKDIILIMGICFVAAGHPILGGVLIILSL